MDHLPLPTGHLANPLLQVPFVCNDDFSYDDQGFLTYPYRAGVDLQELLERKLADIDCLAPFIQAWLWFGLLGELLYIGSRPYKDQRITSCESFIHETSDGKRVLSTVNLNKYIHEAGKRNKTIRQDDFYATRFNSCMDKAKDAIEHILTSQTCLSDIDRSPNFADLPIFYTIILSIQILIEALDSSRHILLPAHPDEPTPPAHHLELLNKRLHEAGWCAYKAAHLPRSFHLRYYLSFMRHADFPTPDNHLSCTPTHCTASAPPKTPLTPHHTTPTCRCPSQTVPAPQLAHILSTNHIPLLTFSAAPTGAGPRQLHLLSTPWSPSSSTPTPKPPFIAISHVRRAGLGNTTANALPTCQLSRLQDLATRCCPTTTPTPTAFWIDALCIPASKHHPAHAAALARIRWVYANATKVLVLDPSLYAHPAGGSAEEALVRIGQSLWKRRLWTLQEGFVARALCFWFWDGVVELDGLLVAYESSEEKGLLRARQQRFGGWGAVGEYLGGVLGLLEGDVKAVKRMGWVEGVSCEVLWGVLRVGYLAAPRYRYFVDEGEGWGMAEVLGVLARVYLDPPGMPLRAGLRTGEEVLEGLRRVQEVGRLLQGGDGEARLLED